MGRRSLAHLSAARNLGHPIEGRKRKRRNPTPRKKSSPEHTLPVSAKQKRVVLDGLTVFDLAFNPAGGDLGYAE